jgi:hypothetical protein
MGNYDLPISRNDVLDIMDNCGVMMPLINRLRNQADRRLGV